MQDDVFEVSLISVLSVIALALCGWLFWAALKEERQWAVFKESHDCKIVQRVSGDVLPITTIAVNSNGSVTSATSIVVTPEKVAYKCNDGVTYVR